MRFCIPATPVHGATPRAQSQVGHLRQNICLDTAGHILWSTLNETVVSDARELKANIMIVHRSAVLKAIALLVQSIVEDVLVLCINTKLPCFRFSGKPVAQNAA